MVRTGNDVASVARLDDAPFVHDDDPVTQLAGKRDIMRDHQQRKAALALQSAQQRDNLGCHQRVECRRRLVKQQ